MMCSHAQTRFTSSPPIQPPVAHKAPRKTPECLAHFSSHSKMSVGVYFVFKLASFFYPLPFPDSPGGQPVAKRPHEYEQINFAFPLCSHVRCVRDRTPPTPLPPTTHRQFTKSGLLLPVAPAPDC